MEVTLTLLFLILGVFCLGAVLRFGLLRRRIAAFRFRPYETRELPRGMVPDLVEKLAAPHEPGLAEIGFTFHHSREIKRVGARTQPEAHRVYLHEEWGVYLLISRGQANGTEPVPRFWFMTFLADGRLLMTDTGSPSVLGGEMGEEVTQYVPEALASQLFERHTHWVADQVGTSSCVLPDIDAFTELLKMHQLREFQTLAERGEMERLANGQFQLAASTVRKEALRMLFLRASLRPASDLSAQVPAKGGLPLPDLTLEERAELDREELNAMRGQELGQAVPWVGKLFWLALLGFAFFAGFGVPFTEGSFVAVLLVLGLHEAGHLLGMRLAKCHDFSILILPFLGAMTTGKEGRLTPWREFFALILGPMPGILLALAVLVLWESPPIWVLQTAGFGLFFNLCQLLPFAPFDGGRIWDLLWFRRFPVLRPVGGIVAAGVGLLPAWLGMESPWLTALAILLLVQVWLDWHTVRVLRAVQAAGSEPWLMEEPAFLTTAFGWMLRQGKQYRSYGFRRLTALQLLGERLRQPAPIPVALGGMALLLLPLAALMGYRLFDVKRSEDRLLASLVAVDPESLLPPATGAFQTNAAPAVLAALKLLRDREARIWLEANAHGERPSSFAESAAPGQMIPVPEVIQALQGGMDLPDWRRDIPMTDLQEEWLTLLHLLLREGEGETADPTLRPKALGLCRLLAQSPFAEDQALARQGYRVVVGRLLELAAAGRAPRSPEAAMLLAGLPPGPAFFEYYWNAKQRTEWQAMRELHEALVREQNATPLWQRFFGPVSQLKRAEAARARVDWLAALQAEGRWDPAADPGLTQFLAEMAVADFLIGRLTPPHQRIERDPAISALIETRIDRKQWAARVKPAADFSEPSDSETASGTHWFSVPKPPPGSRR